MVIRRSRNGARDMNAKIDTLTCAICGQALPDPEYARKYPNIVCRECEKRAVNAQGEPPEYFYQCDYGDNPVFIDGKKCWRRYRFGGYITMLDNLDCKDIGEFYDLHMEIPSPN
jgi:hypothetical protein